MCGIAGTIDFAGRVDPAVLERMCCAIEHRGPDSRGIWCEGGVGLGIQRLAIIDLDGGDQPIFNEDGSIAVVMNGEIYNFETLRSDLIQRGHSFATRSDTEVLVHLYEDYGEQLVDRLRGMFAFAIWDARQRQVLLARDRVGKKPLFVARRGTKLWFASEIMSMLQDDELARTPDPQAIASYLALGYVPHPLSAIADVEKLPPASTLIVTADSASRGRYWELDYADADAPGTLEESAESLRELIWEATRIRLMSEVPLGALLSGGIDSSAVVAAMADQTAEPVKTFSIGFPEADFDELRFARMIAQRFSTDHHEFIVEPHAIEIMPKLARHYGEPFADPSAIPSFYLAEMTSRHVTVALNGDGGDESFAGYRRYLDRRIVSRLGGMPAGIRRLAPGLVRPLGNDTLGSSARARIQRLARVLAVEPDQRYAHWMSVFPPRLCADMLQPEFLASTTGWSAEKIVSDAWHRSTADNAVERMLDTDVNTYLPGDLLVKMDIATMAHSVETRSPLLDDRLMKFSAQLPARLKSDGRSGKVLMKHALRGIVPDEILDRPKMGFGVPLERWFRKDLRDLPAEVLLGPDARVHAYVKPDAITRMIKQHHDNQADHSTRLWALLQLEFWHREVLESRPLGGAGVPSAALRSGRPARLPAVGLRPSD
jgi:asparagine synthase (glutamine-hydrolysing)